MRKLILVCFGSMLLGLTATSYGMQASQKTILGALKVAIQNNKTASVATLLSCLDPIKKSLQTLIEECGASTEIKDRNGNTLLLLAAVKGYPDSIEYLLSKHASINATDTSGQTALTLATQKQNQECLEKLIMHNKSKI